MTNIQVIYRCCNEDKKAAFRPSYFSKLDCLENFLDVFKYEMFIKNVSINITAVYDGADGSLSERLEYHDIDTHKINVNSNEQSLLYSLNLGHSAVYSDIVYFLEDDYLHTNKAVEQLIEGFSINPDGIVSGYDHPDRYTRTDDVDYGQTNIFLGKDCYWRTGESTTCTWAVRPKIFSEMYNTAVQYKLNDRELFRSLRKSGIKLITPMPGFSTHCHEPFMSKFINWADQ